jgi:DNA-binding XRE family transcriptional regulator
MNDLITRLHALRHRPTWGELGNEAAAEIEKRQTALKMQQPRFKWSMRPRFREWREARNMTQQQVADILGVTQPAVMKWETEQRKTSLALITRYANAFDEHPLQFIALEMSAALGGDNG